MYAPKYYSKFKCIAHKCRHSCCVGWEIDVDEAALERYARLDGENGRAIRESIEYFETPHFKLENGDRCPHLDQRGLCKIILGVGEEYLCDICREHPRFYNYTCRGKEAGLGMCCEEACRIILASDDYCEMAEIEGESAEPVAEDFDAVAHREKIYKILADRSVKYSDRLHAICSEYGVSTSVLSDSEWRAFFSGLEYLHGEDRRLFESFSSDIGCEEGNEKILERALAYFIYRHCSEAEDENELCTSLGFCLVCERLLASMCACFKETDHFELAVTLSEEIEYSEENTEKIKEIFKGLS